MIDIDCIWNSSVTPLILSLLLLQAFMCSSLLSFTLPIASGILTDTAICSVIVAVVLDLCDRYFNESHIKTNHFRNSETYY